MNYPIRNIRLRKRSEAEKRRRKPIPKIIIPSFFTLMNLFCGFISIILVSEGNLIFGAWLIVFAAMFDAMDGFMARLTNSSSEFGIELDSISDVVSFGVAPAFLLYTFVMHEMAIIGIILTSLIPVCGAIRLARFNVQTKEIRYDIYQGLPIPVQAVMMAAFFLTFHKRLDLFEPLNQGIISVLIPTLLVMAFLMVSTIPFDKMPKFDKESFQTNRNRFILFFIYFIVIFIFQDIGLILVFTFYIAKGLAFGLRAFWRTGRFQQQP